MNSDDTQVVVLNAFPVGHLKEPVSNDFDVKLFIFNYLTYKISIYEVKISIFTINSDGIIT